MKIQNEGTSRSLCVGRSGSSVIAIFTGVGYREKSIKRLSLTYFFLLKVKLCIHAYVVLH